MLPQHEDSPPGIDSRLHTIPPHRPPDMRHQNPPSSASSTSYTNAISFQIALVCPDNHFAPQGSTPPQDSDKNNPPSSHWAYHNPRIPLEMSHTHQRNFYIPPDPFPALHYMCIDTSLPHKFPDHPVPSHTHCHKPRNALRCLPRARICPHKGFPPINIHA